MKTAKLYNRGPHTIAYRGTVEFHGGVMHWQGASDERGIVQFHHGDVICPHLDHFHDAESVKRHTPLCPDATDLSPLENRQ